MVRRPVRPTKRVAALRREFRQAVQQLQGLDIVPHDFTRHPFFEQARTAEEARSRVRIMRRWMADFRRCKAWRDKSYITDGQFRAICQKMAREAKKFMDDAMGIK